MKRLTILLLLASLLLMAFDWQPFTQMFEFPTSLDDLYDKIENAEYGYVWSDCTANEVTGAFVTWAQVREIADMDTAAGRIQVAQAEAQRILTGVSVEHDIDASEGDAFTLLLVEFIGNGYLSCGVDGKPTLYGDGVQRVIDGLLD